MDRKRVVRLVGLIVVVCLVGTAVTLIISRLIFGTVTNEPITVEMEIDAPEQVRAPRVGGEHTLVDVEHLAVR